MSQAEDLLNSLSETMIDHKHTVPDSDTYFIIDPYTRQIENTNYKKTVLMQGDHNSERFTFELARYVDGHDMSLCNRVMVHFDNVGDSIENIYSDVAYTDDLRLSPDNPETVICSWLIRREATQIVGILSFSLQYQCVEENEITYEWNTDSYDDIEVRKGKQNGEAAVTKYTNVLEQWRSQIFGAGDSVMANIAAEVEGQVAAVKEVSAAEQEAIEQKGADTLASITADYEDVLDEIEESLNQTVKFTAQSLTDAQKEQVRSNVGVSTPDWNAAEGEPGHVLNRTHWVEGEAVEVMAEITTPLTNERFTPISIPPCSVSVGDTITVNWNGAEYSCTGIDASDAGFNGAMFGNFGLATGGTDTGEPFIIVLGGDEDGYHALVSPLDGSTEATLSIHYNAETIHKLDPKFLPDGVPYEQTTIGEVPLNLTFDGDLTGKECISPMPGLAFVKVSSAVVTMEELYGGTCVGINTDGTDIVIDIVEGSQLIASGEMIGAPGCFIIGENCICVQTNSDIFGIALAPGIYFAYSEKDGIKAYNKSLSHPTLIVKEEKTTIHKLDPKFLPDGVPYEQTTIGEVPFNFTFDGDMTGKEVLDLTEKMGMYMVKMTNAVLSADDLIGATCTAVSGEQEVSNEVTADLIADVNGDGSILGTDLFMAVQYDCDFAGTIFTTGLYFPCFPGEAYCKALVKEGATVTEEKTTVKKLDPKFLPDSIGGGADWNAAEGEPGHVLNRTHYTENGMVEILSQKTLDVTSAGYDIIWDAGSIEIVPSKKYSVLWNGVEYEVESQSMDDAVAVLENNVFQIIKSYDPAAASEADKWFIMVMPKDGSTEVVLSINEFVKVVHKLDPKFLPDTVATKAYVEEIILGGAW